MQLVLALFIFALRLVGVCLATFTLVVWAVALRERLPGEDPGQQLVVTLGTGMTSAALFAVAHHLRHAVLEPLRRREPRGFDVMPGGPAPPPPLAELAEATAPEETKRAASTASDADRDKTPPAD